MNWIEITDESQIERIKEESFEHPVVIFKHSTRCSISAMAKNRLERETAVAGVAFYYLDLIRYRAISNRIAEVFEVVHESPQVLMISKGACIYDESHNGIDMAEIADAALATN